MATVSPVISYVRAQAQDVPKVVWSGIVTGDTIVALPVTGYNASLISAQVGGTFGGATVTLEVSNDGVTYAGAKDLHGTAVSLTAAGLVQVPSSAMYIKPVVTSGSANSIDVTLVLRGY